MRLVTLGVTRFSEYCAAIQVEGITSCIYFPNGKMMVLVLQLQTEKRILKFINLLNYVNDKRNLAIVVLYDFTMKYNCRDCSGQSSNMCT